MEVVIDDHDHDHGKLLTTATTSKERCVLWYTFIIRTHCRGSPVVLCIRLCLCYICMNCITK